jgi:sec-independent protein translocase protein TatB
MNIFSNVGITELVVILLLALLVVGPERLPEMGRKLAQILRDIRKMYDNLTSELGPELMTIQQGAQELRQSVESVTSIPKDAVQSVVEAADLDDTVAELKEITSGLEEVGQTVSGVGKMVKDPVSAAVGTARDAILPSGLAESEVDAEDKPAEVKAAAERPAEAGAASEELAEQEEAQDLSGEQSDE